MALGRDFGVSVLLDTHILYWWITGSSRLSARHRQVIAEETEEVLVSAVTGWEIAIKSSIGKLAIGYRVEPELRVALLANGLDVLPVTWEDIGRLERLPLHHGDPFDRLLIVQALRLGLRAVTPDDTWAEYGVARIWT